MPDATYPPLRMRFSFESRCRIVQLILAGESPHAAAAACRSSLERPTAKTPAMLGMDWTRRASTVRIGAN